jgi:hypothetical protein
MASFLLHQEGPEPVDDADAVEAALGNMAIDSDMESNGTEDSRQDRPKQGPETHFGDIEENGNLIVPRTIGIKSCGTNTNSLAPRETPLSRILVYGVGTSSHTGAGN